MSYVISVGDDGSSYRIADEESIAVLFVAIERSCGIKREAAEPLLADGKMLGTEDFIVCHERTLASARGDE